MAHEGGTSLFKIYVPTIRLISEVTFPVAAMYQRWYIGAPFPKGFDWMTPIYVEW